MDRLPVELAIAISQQLPFSDALSLSSTCKGLSSLIRPTIFETIQIHTCVDKKQPPSEARLLESYGSCVKVLKFSSIQLFHPPIQRLVSNLPHLEHIQFTYSPGPLEILNHFFLVFTTILKIPTLKSIRCTIDRSFLGYESRRYPFFDHNRNWIDHGGASAPRGLIKASKVKKLVEEVQDAAANGTVCKLQKLEIRYLIGHGRGSPPSLRVDDFWDDFLQLINMLEPCVRELKELDFGCRKFSAGRIPRGGWWKEGEEIPLWKLEHLKKMTWKCSNTLPDILGQMMEFDQKDVDADIKDKLSDYYPHSWDFEDS